MSELLKRVLVALIAIPLAIFAIYMGGWLLFIITAVISSLALWEYYGLTEKKHAYPNKILGVISGLTIMLIFQFFPLIIAFIYAVSGFIIFILVELLFELWRKKPNVNINFSATVTGVMYVSFSFSFLFLLRNLYQSMMYIQNSTIDFITVNNPFLLKSTTESAWLLLCIFISIWICDTAAYIVGKGIGKNKLFERVSPNKTWEGAIAGFIFAIIAFWAAAEILLEHFPLEQSIIIGIITGIFGQAGDLAESQLKRDAGVKDSSNIIPGHGGVLDRFDSILFVFPIVYIYLLLSSISLN